MALDTDPLGSAEDDELGRDSSRMFVPPFALGAILGHTNIVSAALHELGGRIEAPIGFEFNDEDGEVDWNECDNHCPSEVFYWVIMKNMPEMLSFLVKACGFQFRWIGEEHNRKIMQRLFDAHPDESFPKWVGEIDEKDLNFEGMESCKRQRAKHRVKAASNYKKQMEMLDLLVSLGLLLALFFPADPKVDAEEKLFQDGQLNTRQEQSMSRGVE